MKSPGWASRNAKRYAQAGASAVTATAREAMAEAEAQLQAEGNRFAHPSEVQARAQAILAKREGE
jgi:hypothetical protein